MAPGSASSSGSPSSAPAPPATAQAPLLLGAPSPSSPATQHLLCPRPAPPEDLWAPTAPSPASSPATEIAELRPWPGPGLRALYMPRTQLLGSGPQWTVGTQALRPPGARLCPRRRNWAGQCGGGSGSWDTHLLGPRRAALPPLPPHTQASQAPSRPQERGLQPGPPPARSSPQPWPPSCPLQPPALAPLLPPPAPACLAPSRVRTDLDLAAGRPLGSCLRRAWGVDAQQPTGRVPRTVAPPTGRPRPPGPLCQPQPPCRPPPRASRRLPPRLTLAGVSARLPRRCWLWCPAPHGQVPGGCALPGAVGAEPCPDTSAERRPGVGIGGRGVGTATLMRQQPHLARRGREAHEASRWVGAVPPGP